MKLLHLQSNSSVKVAHERCKEGEHRRTSMAVPVACGAPQCDSDFLSVPPVRDGNKSASMKTSRSWPDAGRGVCTGRNFLHSRASTTRFVFPLLHSLSLLFLLFYSSPRADKLGDLAQVAQAPPRVREVTVRFHRRRSLHEHLKARQRKVPTSHVDDESASRLAAERLEQLGCRCRCSGTAADPLDLRMRGLLGHQLTQIPAARGDGKGGGRGGRGVQDVPPTLIYSP